MAIATLLVIVAKMWNESTKVSITKWMDKETMVHLHNGILFGYKIWNSVNWSKMSGIREHYVKWNKPDTEKRKNTYYKNTDLIEKKKSRIVITGG
jgi:hypothetical protein